MERKILLKKDILDKLKMIGVRTGQTIMVNCPLSHGKALTRFVAKALSETVRLPLCAKGSWWISRSNGLRRTEND